ncbi:MAG: universal stress protein [Candidatus Obscuribacterales bacterium]|jgi:nucleotide-binding universal stress UspA family protein
MKVLIAIDDSNCSSNAVDSAAGQTWQDDTEFRLISVMAPIYNEYLLAGLCAPSLEEMQTEYKNQLQQLIDQKIIQLKKSHPQNLINGSVISGEIAESILNYARDWDSDLIILGSHGRTGLDKFWLGSVAEKVLNRSHCSVEVVKLKQCSLGQEDKVNGRNAEQTSAKQTSVEQTNKNLKTVIL